MTSEQEQRHFTRIPFDAQTTIVAPDQQWPCNLYDISLNGALTSRPADCDAQPGDNYKLELQLGSGNEEELRLHLDVQVAHIENGHIGFKVVQMDVDTATHLHRLVELNLGDAHMLERELSELIKQH